MQPRHDAEGMREVAHSLGAPAEPRVCKQKQGPAAVTGERTDEDLGN